MKYCYKCGSELLDEAVICPKCGCQVESLVNNQTPSEKLPASKSAIVLGIIGIITAWLLAIIGHITSVIAICIGINDCIKNKKPTGLILGVIGEVCAIFSSIIGVAIILKSVL